MILERYLSLCKARGEFPSAVAAECGYDKSALTNWKKQAAENGGVCSVYSYRLRNIAEHLGTTSDYLLGLTDEPNDQMPPAVQELVNSPYKMLLLDEMEGMTDKSLEQVIRIMRTIKGMQDD